MEGRIKLTNLQVLEELKANMGHDNLAILGRQIEANTGCIERDCKVSRNGARKILVHAIIDCYSRIQGDDIKRNLKQLQKKYMNGATQAEGEDLAYVELIKKALDAI